MSTTTPPGNISTREPYRLCKHTAESELNAHHIDDPVLPDDVVVRECLVCEAACEWMLDLNEPAH